MKKKRYTNSPNRKERDAKQTKWEKRLEITMLRNQGLTFQQIADKYGNSKQAMIQSFYRTKGKTIEELEQLAKKYE